MLAIDGYRWQAIHIAFTKGVLLRVKMPHDEQLAALHSLDNPAPKFTPAIVAAIEPACVSFLEIVDQAMATDDPRDAEFMAAALRGEDVIARYGGRGLAQRSAHMLTTDPVWSTLTALNPSLLTAMQAIHTPPRANAA